MKRFTETEKWSDPWFRKLTGTVKLGYLYLLDRVDNSGVIDLDTELANFQIGMEIDWCAVRVALGDRVDVLPCGKWHLTRFVGFQFGELKEDCKPHAQVIRLMESHGIDRDFKEYPKGIYTPQDKDKDKDKETDKDSESVESIYAAYPRKVGKLHALKAIRKALKDTPADVLLDRVNYFARIVKGKDPQYIPHPATWFNSGRYLDEPTKPAGTPVRSIPALPEPPNWQAIIDREHPQCAFATGQPYGGRKWASMSPGDQAAVAGAVKPFISQHEHS